MSASSVGGLSGLGAVGLLLADGPPVGGLGGPDLSGSQEGGALEAGHLEVEVLERVASTVQMVVVWRR